MVKNFASIKNAKEEQHIDRVEEGNVQNMLACIESIEMPSEEQDAA